MGLGLDVHGLIKVQMYDLLQYINAILYSYFQLSIC